MKEYLLERDGKYELHKGGIVPDGAIEVPEGAEIAIKFKNNPNKHGIVFYKNNGKSAWSEKYPKWDHDSEWNNVDLLNEDFMDGDIDLSHHVLWSRFTQPEELPFVSLNDQYAEIEKVRHAHYFKDVSDIDEIDVYEVLHRFGVTDPCLQHIVKKALCAGERGHKDFHTDLKNIADTAQRMLEIHGL